MGKRLDWDKIIDKLKVALFLLALLGIPIALAVFGGEGGGVTENYWRGAD
jgi:hypothetical protein